LEWNLEPTILDQSPWDHPKFSHVFIVLFRESRFNAKYSFEPNPPPLPRSMLILGASLTKIVRTFNIELGWGREGGSLSLEFKVGKG
jgi:hypothetical protein